MIPLVDAATGNPLPAEIRTATKADYERTVSENRQTSWLSDFIQQEELEKYALEITEVKELVGLGAYRNMPEGVLDYVKDFGAIPFSRRGPFLLLIDGDAAKRLSTQFLEEE